jgi:hypothetical protein
MPLSMLAGGEKNQLFRAKGGWRQLGNSCFWHAAGRLLAAHFRQYDETRPLQCAATRRRYTLPHSPPRYQFSLDCLRLIMLFR